MKLLNEEQIKKLPMKRLRSYHRSLMAKLTQAVYNYSFYGNCSIMCREDMIKNMDEDDRQRYSEYIEPIKANKKLVMTELYRRRTQAS